jgi:NitT/TauT family transport system ATP-binding protein
MTISIEIRNISFGYKNNKDNNVTLFRNFNLNIPTEKCTVVMGPNGIGKSTLLNIIAGIINPDEGSVEYGNDSDYKKSIVFQRYEESLFEWLTVSDNIGYPLKIKNVPKDKRQQEASTINAQLSLDLPMSKYPYQLSGGQKQRVALARALITSPQILFLDEPFVSLDLDSKRVMQQCLDNLIQNKGLTIILATHEIKDALGIADEVLFLSGFPVQLIDRVSIDLPRPRKLYAFDDIKIGKYLKSLETSLERCFACQNR